MKKYISLFFIVFLFSFLFGCDITTPSSKAPKLETPQNISLVFNPGTKTVTVNFDEVENAYTYFAYVYQDGELYNKYLIDSGGLLRDLPKGTYVIEVQALTNSTDFSDSEISSEGVRVVAEELPVLEIPSNILLSFNEETNKVTVSFAEVIGASSYKAYIYQNDTLINSFEVANGSSIGMSNGEYRVEIQAIGDNVNYRSSAVSSEGKTVTVNNSIEPSTPSSLSYIQFEGIQNVDVAYNSLFHVLSGIRVCGNDGATYLPTIEVSSNGTLNGYYIPSDFSGSITVTYHATYLGLEATASRTINVLPEGVEVGNVALGENIASNSDFSAGTSGWALANHEGASSTMEVTNQGLVIHISSLNWTNSSSPRLSNTQLISLEMGKTYQVSFDASATQDKMLFVQVGKLLSAAPYFIDYKPDSTEYFQLTQQMQNFSFSFTYKQETTTEASLLFEMGIINGIATVADVTFDNIEVKEYLSSVEDIAPPYVTGVDEESVYIGSVDSYNPLDGIQAIDNVDGNLTNRIVYEVFQNGERVNEVNITEPGTYQIVYRVSDNSENVTEVVKTLNVKTMDTNQGNLLTNGDFNDGINGWEIAQHEGGYADYKFVNGQLEIVMEGLNWNKNSSSPRLNTNIPITLIRGKAYLVSFDAYSTDPKTILVQVGEFLNGAPYWIDYKPETYETFALTSTLTHYEFEFVMEGKTSDRASLSFEMGTVNGDATITNIFYDNVSFEMIDEEIGDYIDPEILYLQDRYFTVGEINSFNFLQNVEAFDETDGDVTDSLSYEIYLDGNIVPSINFNTPNTYVIKYSANDANGNVAHQSIHFVMAGSRTTTALTNWTKEVKNGASDINITSANGATTVALGVNGGTDTYDAMVLSNAFNLTTLFNYSVVLDISSSAERDITVKIGRYAYPNDFYQVLSQKITVFADQTRYMLSFYVSNTYDDYQLGLEMGPNYDYSYVQSNVTIHKAMVMKTSYQLSQPVGLELHTIAEGTIIALAPVNNALGYLLYVYDLDGNLVNTYDIYPGIILDTLNIPQGSYTLKVQGVGGEKDGVIYLDSQLSQGISYTV